MKIVFFTDTYYPQINGVVKSIELFSKQLRKLGNEVHIFCPDGIPKEKYIHPISSSEFKNYPEYRVGLPTFKIIKEIKKINPDVIHIHSPFTIGLIGMSIAKILKIPIVATYHTLFSEYFSYTGSSSFKKEIVDKYAKCFFDRTSIVIVPSKPIKDLLKTKRPVKVLPTPLDLKITKNNKKMNSKLAILHVGRLCKEKKIDIILKAFARICKKINANLIITSDGPDKERLERLCKKLEIESNVTFTGYISDKKLSELYSSSDVFVSASDTETQGLVILEAMANGCPVIARDALGFKDFIENGKNGILFNTEDELIKNISLIKRDSKLRNELIKNGHETVRKFNISNYVKKMEDIYKESFNKKIDSKTIWKVVYASCLFFSSLEFWLIEKLKIPINSKLIDLHISIFKIVSYFERINELI
jgi:glycosyltransferase involved in cell wall biosynthesis